MNTSDILSNFLEFASSSPEFAVTVIGNMAVIIMMMFIGQRRDRDEAANDDDGLGGIQLPPDLFDGGPKHGNFHKPEPELQEL